MSTSSTDPQVHFVSLGCPKNRVDSELMLGQMQDHSMRFTPNADEADVVVINTCGFIEDAKKESIDVIVEMANLRKEGQLKKLIVTGCLVQRYAKELRDEIPEIDALLGNGEYHSVAQIARGLSPADDVVHPPEFLHQATNPRVNTFRPHSAYVKVSEGCDQKCTFCIIPSLRGLQRSRSIEDVAQEVRALVDRGVVELNLVAQDLTGFGTDLSPKKNLADLLEALVKIEEARWIRLHYAYPRPFPKKLLDLLAHEEKLLSYIDMPLQHISDPVLKRMRRGRPRRFIQKLLDQLREAMPDLTLRSSFIVGFPGETDADFQELCDFVSQEDFERVGVFKFSQEEGTPSHDMEQVEPHVIEARHAALMQLLKEKSNTKMATYLGRRIPVLVDGVSEETELLLAGRHKGQAPEIDGTTYINDGYADVGDLVEIEVTETFDYDIVGHITRMIAKAPERPDHPRLEASAGLISAPITAGRRALRVLQD